MDPSFGWFLFGVQFILKNSNCSLLGQINLTLKVRFSWRGVHLASIFAAWSKKSCSGRPTLACETWAGWESNGGREAAGEMAVGYRLVSTTGVSQSKQCLAVHLHTYTLPQTPFSRLVSHISLTLQIEMENMCAHKESKGREVYIGLLCSHSEGYMMLLSLFFRLKPRHPCENNRENLSDVSWLIVTWSHEYETAFSQLFLNFLRTSHVWLQNIVNV